jgi:large conductance mechanosensitive channel
MAVGIIIGAAFGAIVTAFVGDVLMPVIGLFLGGTDFSNQYVLLREGATVGPYASLADAKEAGAITLGYGLLINAVVNFTIVAFALFMLIRGMSTMKQKAAEAPKPPPAPSKEETLLTEIRDLLARR